MNRNRLAAVGVSALALVATAFLGAGPASAHGSEGHHGGGKNVTLEAHLTELNGSGAWGDATALIRNKKIKHIEVNAYGLSPDAPHAQHIHYGEQALNECPTLAQDANGDGRLTTVEGIPAYGPVAVSLTTSGDTSPVSFLDVTRFPVAENGEIHYSRNNLRFTDVEGAGTAKDIAEAVRNGEGVVVIHGVDYDGNGAYSLSEEGASELDGSLPAEATDPAVCGVLR